MALSKHNKTAINKQKTGRLSTAFIWIATFVALNVETNIGSVTYRLFAQILLRNLTEQLAYTLTVIYEPVSDNGVGVDFNSGKSTIQTFLCEIRSHWIGSHKYLFSSLSVTDLYGTKAYRLHLPALCQLYHAINLESFISPLSSFSGVSSFCWSSGPSLSAWSSFCLSKELAPHHKMGFLYRLYFRLEPKQSTVMPIDTM